MTESERFRFEQEKERAQRQFHEMYRPKPTGGTAFSFSKAAGGNGSQAGQTQLPLAQNSALNGKKPAPSTQEAPKNEAQAPKPKADAPKQKAAPPNELPPRPCGRGFDLLKMLNFEKIEMDNDRLLLLMLCLLLANEKADEKLLLALIYIML